MNDPARNLSQFQRLTVESCYVFLKTLRPILMGLRVCDPSSQIQLQNLVSSAVLNESRLVEAFHEVADAEKRWGGQ